MCVFYNPYHVMLLYIKSPWIMMSDMLSPHMGDIYLKPPDGRSLSRLTKSTGYAMCQQVEHCLAGT